MQDVGTKPHRSEDRSAGVATTGVALQGPAVKKSTSNKSGSVQSKEVAGCKDSVQRGQCANPYQTDT